MFARIVLIAACLSVTAGCVNQNRNTNASPVVSNADVPTDQRQMIREIQTMLGARGFSPGPSDGSEGARTRSALAAFQAARRLPVTSGATSEAYLQLRRDAQSTTGAATTAPSASVNRSPGGQQGSNDRVVTFRRACDGLSIPTVRQQMFQGAVPVFAMRVQNTSQTRYRVTYDVTFQRQTNNLHGRFASNETTEKNFISRPGALEEFLIARAGDGVTGVASIVVLSCDAT